MKSAKGKDVIDEDWIYNCVDLKKLSAAADALGNEGSKRVLKRLVEERITLLTTGPSESQKKEAEKIRLKGNECISKKDYKDALTYYTSSIKLDPTEPSTFGNRALVYIRRKEFEKALEDSNNAILLNKDFSRGYQRRAEACLGLKDYAKAYIALRALAKKDPASKGVLLFRNKMVGRRPDRRSQEAHGGGRHRTQ